MRLGRVAAVTIAILAALALTGCGSATPDATAPGSGSLAPLQIDPTVPADKAQETVEDANTVIDEQSTGIDELTEDQ